MRAILDSHDLAVNLRGAAGTGKTATLQELHSAAWSERGPAGGGGGSDARGGEHGWEKRKAS